MDRTEVTIQEELKSACFAGELQKVQSLLEEWKSLSSTSPPPMESMLNIAARQSHPALVSFLLKNRAEISPSTTVSACISNSIEVFEAYLSAGLDINLTVGHTGDPLIMCVGSRKIALVKWLLAHGADPNANIAAMRQTVLETASLSGSVEIADLLVKHGAQLKETNVLKHASYYGYLDMMAYLLDQGLDINDIPDNDYIIDAERQAGLGQAYLHFVCKFYFSENEKYYAYTTVTTDQF